MLAFAFAFALAVAVAETVAEAVAVAETVAVAVAKTLTVAVAVGAVDGAEAAFALDRRIAPLGDSLCMAERDARTRIALGHQGVMR